MTSPVLINQINNSNLTDDAKETIISYLGALDDWSEFGDQLVEDLGIDWYCEKVEKYKGETND
jgi:extradiol dioxygenase family protein